MQGYLVLGLLCAGLAWVCLRACLRALARSVTLFLSPPVQGPKP